MSCTPSSLSSASRLLRRNLRAIKLSELRAQQAPRLAALHYANNGSKNHTYNSTARFFQTSNTRLGLMPETDDPAPRESEPMQQFAQPTELSIEDYHKHADAYLDELVEKLEEAQDISSEVEVEYSAGVLTVEIAGKGSYVLNKQPPNKQIWLSSPISGPKRFDWVTLGESMNHKEGSGSGDWVYLRDGSSLTDIIFQELNVKVVQATDAVHEEI